MHKKKSPNVLQQQRIVKVSKYKIFKMFLHDFTRFISFMILVISSGPNVHLLMRS